ncbi:MAG: GIY-YIG nuclease family protein [Pseudomonadota bacterium]
MTLKPAQQPLPALWKRTLTDIDDLTPNGSVPFAHTERLLVPKRAGVYLIHDLRGPLYVGATADFTRRFHEHFWLPTNAELAHAVAVPFGQTLFTWFLKADRKERFALERRLIRDLFPACNQSTKNPTN